MQWSALKRVDAQAEERGGAACPPYPDNPALHSEECWRLLLHAALGGIMAGGIRLLARGLHGFPSRLGRARRAQRPFTPPTSGEGLVVAWPVRRVQRVQVAQSDATTFAHASPEPKYGRLFVITSPLITKCGQRKAGHVAAANKGSLRSALRGWLVM